MPPKGKGKKKAPMIIDGVDTTQMTREQLEVFALRLKEENEREREERNYFQLERDKLRTFWEITKNELEEAKAKLRNKDRQIEESTEKNDAELKFYKQKVKHLQYEHQNDLTQNKTDNLVALKMAQDDHLEQEREILKDKRDLKMKMREQEVAHQEQVKALKLQHSEEISKIRNEFEGKAKELELKYDKLLDDLKKELHIKHNMEMAEMEERKDYQITELTKHHEKAFNDIKNYYNDITLNNLALINSLKEQMESLRKQNERMSKQVSDLTAENRNLIEPLKQAQADVTEYKRQLTNYNKDKLSLQNTKVKLKDVLKQLEDLGWENDALQLRFDKVEAEKNTLSERFMDAVLNVQQHSGMKNVLLMKRVERLIQDVEQKDVIIQELKNLSKGISPQKNQKLDELLLKKDALIHDLQYELARVCKAHDDLIETYEEKLLQYGIPKIELGFVPLRILPEKQGGLSKAPAGLVAKKLT